MYVMKIHVCVCVCVSELERDLKVVIPLIHISILKIILYDFIIFLLLLYKFQKFSDL